VKRERRTKGSFPEEIFPFSQGRSAGVGLAAPLTYAASVGNLGKAPFHFRKLYLGQIFNDQELTAGSFAHSNQLI